jgi:hypothetical protein
VTFPDRLLNEGERVVISTRTHPKALVTLKRVVDRMFGCGTLVVTDASTDGAVRLHDIPRVEEVQLQVAEELHQLSGPGRADDGT